MRAGIAAIFFGLVVIVFTALFGFPKAPPKPEPITYEGATEEPMGLQQNSYCSTYGIAITGGVVTSIDTATTNTCGTYTTSHMIIDNNYFEESKP